MAFSLLRAGTPAQIASVMTVVAQSLRSVSKVHWIERRAGLGTRLPESQHLCGAPVASLRCRTRFGADRLRPGRAERLSVPPEETSGEEDLVSLPPATPVTRLGDLWLCGDPPRQHRVLCADSTSPEAVSRLLGECKPFLMITDPPYGIELDSEWRDRAGLNGCGPAEASYMKHRTEGHTQTEISGDTRADWSLKDVHTTRFRGQRQRPTEQAEMVETGVGKGRVLMDCPWA